MISVIIPIYNVAKYLPRCFDSILSQKNSDFEVVMVDDGSTDNSAAVCKEMSERDARFKLFTKDNGGVSSARNYGLEKAEGEYIAFIDGDDAVDPDFLTFEADIQQVDVVEKSYRTISDVETEDVDLMRDACIEGYANVERYYRGYVTTKALGVFNKIISRRVIGGTRFDEAMFMGEDFFFFLNILPNIKSYYLDSKGKYFYFRNNGSASSKVESNVEQRVNTLRDNVMRLRSLGKRQRQLRPLSDYITYELYVPRISALADKEDFGQNDFLTSVKRDWYKADKRLFGFRQRLYHSRQMLNALIRH